MARAVRHHAHVVKPKRPKRPHVHKAVHHVPRPKRPTLRKVHDKAKKASRFKLRGG